MRSLLVANRGEIASRIFSTARRLGIETIAVYSEADADLPFVLEADQSVCIGPASPAESYLNTEAIFHAAAETHADAIHPGYGFLSENAQFATDVQSHGLIWVGPSPEAIEQMGDKVAARGIMERSGVPVLPGSADPVFTAEDAVAEAEAIGYPVMVKASAGGGGIGMSIAANADEVAKAFDTATSRAQRFFNNPAVLIERYIPRARHVEVQILGQHDGSIITFPERDCSVQRRHQKVAEESPSPVVGDTLRAELRTIAANAGRAVGYQNAGTVEMLLDVDTHQVYFLEMNTRLQVEHPITEMITGVDLVEEQIRIAQGLPSTITESPQAHGCAVEMRIYAEDPRRFLPGPGLISDWRLPEGEHIRVDAGYRSGVKVTPYYDPLMAKVSVWGATRAEMIERARSAAHATHIAGPKCNVPFFSELFDDQAFVSGDYTTHLIEQMRS